MRFRSKWHRQFLIVLLCHLLAFQPLLAQSASQGNMRIVIVQGADAKNVLQQIAPLPLIVRVQDSAGLPIPDVDVAFTAPSSGPSGQFENDSRTIRSTTDSGGIATSGSYHPNALAGSYMITVRAEYRGQTATTSIQQFNVEKKSRTKMLLILGAAGGIAGALAASNRSSNKAPAATAPTITFGTGTVGAPGQ